MIYIKEFEANKQTVRIGEPVLFHWQFTDFSGVLTINDTVISVNQKDWIKLNFKENSKISLSLINDGQIVETKLINIKVQSVESVDAIYPINVPKFDTNLIPNFRRHYYDLIKNQTPLPKLHLCPDYEAFKLLNSNKLVLEIENARDEVRRQVYEPLQDIVKNKTGISFIIELKKRILKTNTKS